MASSLESRQWRCRTRTYTYPFGQKSLNSMVVYQYEYPVRTRPTLTDFLPVTRTKRFRHHCLLPAVAQISTDLILCIEHLDYAREAHVRPGIDGLLPSRRALHIISCLLSNMPVIVNSAVGRATAVAFCDDLSLCVRALRSKVTGLISRTVVLVAFVRGSFLSGTAGVDDVSKGLLEWRV